MKKPPDKLLRVGIVANSGKTGSASTVQAAARMIARSGREVASDRATASLAKFKGTIYRDASHLAAKVDLLVVFGGDGTMLRIAREIAGSRTPVLGINIGGLGFLTAVPSTNLAQALKQIWRGDYEIESRTLLTAFGECSGRALRETALNDIVISRGIASRLIELEVRVDQDALSVYRCDGLIVSSPTGSTAYSLAAGGAVLFPTADVVALTPICPHTLTNRSLILPAAASISIKVITPGPSTILSVDGQLMSELAMNDQVTVKRSQRTVRLVRLGGTSFCDTLRRKLHWRGGSV